MGIISIFRLLWVMQDLYHQQYHLSQPVLAVIVPASGAALRRLCLTASTASGVLFPWSPGQGPSIIGGVFFSVFFYTCKNTREPEKILNASSGFRVPRFLRSPFIIRVPCFLLS